MPNQPGFGKPTPCAFLLAIAISGHIHRMLVVLSPLTLEVLILVIVCRCSCRYAVSFTYFDQDHARMSERENHVAIRP